MLSKVLKSKTFNGFCLVIGLALVFNSQIQNTITSWLQKQASEQKITASEKKIANFDFRKVKNLKFSDTISASFTDENVIGKIAIPSLNIHLGIYEGVSNSVLAKGVGTMKKDQKMGEGNYALAGHNMDNNSNTLFTPLSKAKTGMHVYLYDTKNKYDYVLTDIKVIYSTEVQYIYDTGNQKLLTLITCAEKGKKRYMLRGELVRVTEQKKADKTK